MESAGLKAQRDRTRPFEANPEIETIAQRAADGVRAATVVPVGPWDLAALLRLRELVWVQGPLAALVLDFSRVRSLDPGALLLLHAELARLAGRGTRVRFLGLKPGLRRQIRRHPIARFLTDEDELFTDPDLEACGFRPSRH